jgi:hypothetical protein
MFLRAGWHEPLELISCAEFFEPYVYGSIST